MNVRHIAVVLMAALAAGCATSRVSKNNMTPSLPPSLPALPALQQAGHCDSAQVVLAIFLHRHGIPGVNADRESVMRIAEELGTASKDINDGSGAFHGTPAYSVKQLLERYGFTAALEYSSSNDGSQMTKLKANLMNNIPTLVQTAENMGKWYLAVKYAGNEADYAGDDVLVLIDPDDRFDGERDGYRIISAAYFDSIWFDPSPPSGVLFRPMITATLPTQTWQL